MKINTRIFRYTLYNFRATISSVENYPRKVIKIQNNPAVVTVFNNNK
jgi:hypothetical protein